MPYRPVTRRLFLRTATLAAWTTAVAACAPEAPPPATATLAPVATATPEPTASPSPTSLPSPTVETSPLPPVAKRPLGKTGIELSVVGFGGIVVMDETEAAAKQYVSQAIARGVNYFDVAPSYGNAESRLGPALEPYRKDVFLACKTEAFTKTGAALSLKQSLERLRTDHFDLYQLHAVTTQADVDTILGPEGAIHALQEARDNGQVKLLGFSAHTEEAAVALLDGFAFDTMLFPVNYVAWNAGKFGPRAVQKAEEKGVSILALKALAKRKYAAGEVKKWYKCWYSPVDSAEEAALALRFTLSRPVVAAVSPSHAELLWWACDAAADPKPLSQEEEDYLAKQAEGLESVFPSA
jgi:aryl-alcohol dehydrogenase-like predicted oxidoreductase